MLVEKHEIKFSSIRKKIHRNIEKWAFEWLNSLYILHHPTDGMTQFSSSPNIFEPFQLLLIHFWFFLRWFYNIHFVFFGGILPILNWRIALDSPLTVSNAYYLLYETGARHFMSRERKKKSIHHLFAFIFDFLFFVANFILSCLAKCMCKTCFCYFAGTKKSNKIKYYNTFNFEANKWHAFTMSIGKAFMTLVSANRNNLKTFFALFHPFLLKYTIWSEHFCLFLNINWKMVTVCMRSVHSHICTNHLSHTHTRFGSYLSWVFNLALWLLSIA